MSDWLHEIAALTTITLAGIWLVLRWLQIGKPRAAAGCSRCEHNPTGARSPGSETASAGIRSAKLRVIE